MFLRVGIGERQETLKFHTFPSLHPAGKKSDELSQGVLSTRCVLLGEPSTPPPNLLPHEGKEGSVACSVAPWLKQHVLCQVSVLRTR